MIRKEWILIIIILLVISTDTFAQENEVVKAPAPAPKPEVAAPLINIKPVDKKEQLYSVELRDVDIRDLFRVFAEDYKLNLLIDNEVQGKVTASFNNLSIEDMLQAIAQANNLVLEKEKNIIKIKLNLVSKVFILNNIEAIKIVQQAAQAQAAAGAAQPAAPAAQGAGTVTVNTIFDLLSDKGKILLGDQPNSIMVIDYPANVARIEEYLSIADQKITAKVFKLNYISVTDIFPEVVEQDREERRKQRTERKEEYEEMQTIQPTSSSD